MPWALSAFHSFAASMDFATVSWRARPYGLDVCDLCWDPLKKALNGTAPLCRWIPPSRDLPSVRACCSLQYTHASRWSAYLPDETKVSGVGNFLNRCPS